MPRQSRQSHAILARLYPACDRPALTRGSRFERQSPAFEALVLICRASAPDPRPPTSGDGHTTNAAPASTTSCPGSPAPKNLKKGMNASMVRKRRAANSACSNCKSEKVPSDTRCEAPWRELPDHFGPYTICFNRVESTTLFSLPGYHSVDCPNRDFLKSNRPWP